jgi:hypothetical protein
MSNFCGKLVFCCYAAHNPTDKLEKTEKILGLARYQRSDQSRKTTKNQESS